MKLSKTVTINNRNITVSELTVKQIKEFWKELTTGNTPDGPVALSNQEFMNKHWDESISGMTLAETEELAPSELKLIYEAYQEVNSVFFALALRVEGDDPMLKALRLAIQLELMARFSGSSNAGIQTYGTTDTASS